MKGVMGDFQWVDAGEIIEGFRMVKDEAYVPGV